MNGLLIVIEGPDGSGKSTLCVELVNRLSEMGHRATHEWEPTGGEIGTLLRGALRGNPKLPPAAMRCLFAADRHAHGPALCRLLDLGYHVVCDRYDLSNVAYRWAECHDPAEVRWAASLSRGCVVPDLTLVLRAPLAMCLDRLRGRGGDAEIYEQADMQKRVHAAYEMSEWLVGRPVQFVDASGSPREVAERAMAVIREKVAERGAV